MTDKIPPPGREIKDIDLMDSKPSKTATNDVFSKTISDAEREILLKGPSSMIIMAIEETLIELGNKTLALAVAQKAISSTMRSGSIPQTVQTFVDRLNGEDQKNLAPYVDGSDREYLGIFCGFINAMRDLDKNDKGAADSISEKFTDKAYAKLMSSPDNELGKKAVFVIVNNFDKKADY